MEVCGLSVDSVRISSHVCCCIAGNTDSIITSSLCDRLGLSFRSAPTQTGEGAVRWGRVGGAVGGGGGVWVGVSGF